MQNSLSLESESGRIAEWGLLVLFGGLVLNAVFGSILGWSPLEAGLAALPELCIFRRVTGWLCPGCGMSHAFVELSRGHLREAMLWNPFSPFLFLTMLGWVAFRRSQFSVSCRPALQKIAAWVVLVAVLGFGFSRNS